MSARSAAPSTQRHIEHRTEQHATKRDQGTEETCERGPATGRRNQRHALPQEEAAARGGELLAALSALKDKFEIVGDVRGTGFFYAIELVKDSETRATFDDDECEELLRGFLSPRLFEKGLICRADDRGDPVIQISPPLVATQKEFDEIAGILGDVLADAGERVR